MIGKYSSEYKALTAPQKAKVRKAIAQYEAERNPIMYEANRRESEVRHQAYIDLNCEARCEEVRGKYVGRMQEIREQISKLNEEWTQLQDTMREEELTITTEPYQVAYADPKREVLHDVWKSITERHEAKMTELLASFKNQEVA